MVIAPFTGIHWDMTFAIPPLYKIRNSKRAANISGKKKEKETRARPGQAGLG
jgi:hypothetical protein